MGANEMVHMVVVENIVNAYRSRAHADNWAEWAQANPAAARMLAEAQEAAENG